MNHQFFVTDVSKHYNLRHHIEGKPSPIYLVLRIFNKQKKIPLGVKVLPHQWNGTRAMIAAYISDLDNKNNDLVNRTIIEFDAKYSEFISYLCTHPDELDCIDNVINSIFGMKKVKKELVSATLTQLILDKNVKEATRKLYSSEIKEFVAFLKSIKKSEISIGEVDVALMRGYIKYLQSKTDIHKITRDIVPIEDNTITFKFGIMYNILKYAEDSDLYDASKIKKLKSTLKKHEVENQIYLNEEEIDKIMNVELDSDLDDIRNIFIFQMELGQRFSDIKAMMGKDVRGLISDGMITIVQKKTGAKVCPPLSPIAKSILEHYSYVLPSMKIEKINEHIKTVCQKANLNEVIHCIEHRGGKPYHYDAAKWQLVSTHSARRSFVSNNIKEGVDSALIKGITGHKTDSAFNLYNRNSNKDLAEAFMKVKGMNVPNGNIPEKEGANPEPTTNVMGDDSNTLKKVLVMLGKNPIDFIMIDDVEVLYRMVVTQENELIELLHCDFKTFKEIFNNDKLDMGLKIKTIKSMIKNHNGE